MSSKRDRGAAYILSRSALERSLISVLQWYWEARDEGDKNTAWQYRKSMRNTSQTLFIRHGVDRRAECSRRPRREA